MLKLSSTLALKNITEKYGGKYFSSAVGEINVVLSDERKKCLIGGEGNGGVIYPMTHYGRDSLIGIGRLFLFGWKKHITFRIKKELPVIYSKRSLIIKWNILNNKWCKKLYDESLIDTTDGEQIFLIHGFILGNQIQNPVIRIISEAPLC